MATNGRTAVCLFSCGSKSVWCRAESGWRMSTNCLLSGRSREGQGPNCQGNQRTGDRKSLILTPPLLDRRLAPPTQSCLAFSLTSYFTQGVEFSCCTQPFFSFFSSQQKVFNFETEKCQLVFKESRKSDCANETNTGWWKGRLSW